MLKDLYAVTLGAAIVAAQQSGGSRPGATRASDGWPRISSLPNGRGIQKALACFVPFVTDGRYSYSKSFPYKADELSPVLRSHP
jgi:hypothetical protein